MPISICTHHVAQHCEICGVKFMTEVRFTMDAYGDIAVIKAAEHECPECQQWGGVELLCAHLMKNLEA